MDRKLILLFVFLAVIAVLAGCQTKETASSPLSANLSEVAGLVEMKQAEQDAFKQAAANTVLGANGQIQTGDDGRVRLDLSSGTIIRVSPSSLFTLTSNEEVEGGLFTKISLEAGKIFIILNGGQADVQTPSGVASVRGSYMKVQVDPLTNDIYITCLEGNCSVINPNGEEINFTNGQSAILFHQDPDGNWKSPLLGEMTPDEFKEWLDENPEAKDLFEQGMATLTAQAATTEAPTEEPTETPIALATVEESDQASNACSKLEEPTDGSSLGKIGQVKFAWTEQPNTQAYVITFVNSDGSTTRVETSTNSAEFFIEVLPTGGTYTWFVTAYGSDGAEICSSTSITFSKPKGDPTQKPKITEEPTQEPPATEPVQPVDPLDCSETQCTDPLCPGFNDPYTCP